MPVSFSSPPRNLFLLGSSGADVVTNFFKSVDQSTSSEDVYRPEQIKYDEVNDKYFFAGTADDDTNKELGWIERRTYDGSTNPATSPKDWDIKIKALSHSTTDTRLRAMEWYEGDGLYVVGYTAAIPWIAHYSTDGKIQWQTSTRTAFVEYTGVSKSAVGVFACGYQETFASVQRQAFVEKFDQYGNAGWGKAAHMLGRDVALTKLSVNNRGEVIAVGYLEDDSADKGYIVKMNGSTGEIIWDRTLERNISGSGGTGPNDSDDCSPANVRCTACHIDGNDQIYIVGSITGNSPVQNGTGEFIVKYSPEGNILWQRENHTDQWDGNVDPDAPYVVPYSVESDTETQQTVVLSVEDKNGQGTGNADILISKYSRDGSLVFRRKISKGSDHLGGGVIGTGKASLDADASFYYILFKDQEIDYAGGEPDRYTFGKVSTSGNGLGDFSYDDYTGTDVDYTIVANAENKIGRLSDGSIRNDESDLITYPFTANKIVFDDLATPVCNKKRQMDTADSFEYSSSGTNNNSTFDDDYTSTGVIAGSNITIPCSVANGNEVTVTDAGHNLTTGDSVKIKLQLENPGMVLVNSSYSTAYEITSTTPTTFTYNITGTNRDGYTGRTFYYDPGTPAFTNDEARYSNPAVRPTDFSQVDLTTDTTIVDGVTYARDNGLAGSSWKLTPVGGTTPVKGTGHDDHVWTFLGNTSEGFLAPNVAALGTNDFSFEVWFKTTGNSGVWPYFFSNKDTFDGPFTRLGLHKDDGYLRFYTEETGGTNLKILGQTDCRDDVWHHAVFTRTGTSGVIYLDGEYDAFGTTMGTDVGNATNDWMIGYTGAGGGGNFLGSMSDFRYYPRCLSQSEVKQNYNATKYKFTNQTPDIAPLIGPGIIQNAYMMTHYDFGNKACFDTAENLFKNNNVTNLVRYNATVNGKWCITAGNTNSTVGPNVISPVGDLTGGTIVYDGSDASTGGVAWAYKDAFPSLNTSNQIQFAEGDTVTLSVFAKIGSSNKVVKSIYLRAYNPEAGYWFNLETGTKAATASENAMTIYAETIDSYGNGWYKCTMTFAIGSNDEIGFQLYLANSGGGTGFNDPEGAGDTIHIWNPQVQRVHTWKDGRNSRPIQTYGTAITQSTTVKTLYEPGNNWNATLVNSQSYHDTTDGVIWFFDNEAGNPSYLDVGIGGYDNINLTEADGWTIETWLMVQDPSSGNYANNAWNYFWRDALVSGSPAFESGIYSDNNTNFAFKDNDTANTQISMTMTPMKWHWIAFGISNSGVTKMMYSDENGTFNTTNSGVAAASGPCAIDKFFVHPNGTQPLRCICGEIRVYNRELLTPEGTVNYNATRKKYGV